MIEFKAVPAATKSPISVGSLDGELLTRYGRRELSNIQGQVERRFRNDWNGNTPYDRWCALVK